MHIITHSVSDTSRSLLYYYAQVYAGQLLDLPQSPEVVALDCVAMCEVLPHQDVVRD
jgi:hypothetical protein